MIDVAFYIAHGCSGCTMSMLDLGERMNDFRMRVAWAAPTLGDGKYDRIPEVDYAFIEGGIGLSEHVEIVRELREKSETLVAFGICASCGGIMGLANLHSKEEILEDVFGSARSSVGELRIPEMLEFVKPLDSVVEVDCYIGGCPPTPEQIYNAFKAIFEGERGWIASGKSVCEFCSRNLAEKLGEVSRFLRVPDKECFLKQGILCFGPATQGDCMASCPNSNSPCRGCGGMLPSVDDHGSALVDMLSSLTDEKGIEALSMTYTNLSKLLYLYTLPSSTLRGKVRRYHLRGVKR
ncbi:MAG: Methylviologen-reducing hydrogenase, subunit gamma (VhuG) [Archaeoglobus fulgidus]|uniref:Methylviologen-reducing hydrogenase, subunit gamma (VhuG) n=1 Tax=Archaeoglobus fulgidus TaxID=2234 RepID=A0A124F804_ARCFL|nr:hypothetical protein [Archaeoglobus fulgidus]KUJ93180.1 MAG: Methylviologen-reducing hydrogenase, subunit gamma (VhuG) [Archaeoglobus fulgidus]